MECPTAVQCKRSHADCRSGSLMWWLVSDFSRCKLQWDLGDYTLVDKVHRLIPTRSLILLINRYLPWDISLVMRHKCRVTVKQKSPTRDFRIGLGEKMGILYHDFFSIPMLLNSSELMFEMSRFAPARATNTSKQTETTRTNIGHTPFFIDILI